MIDCICNLQMIIVQLSFFSLNQGGKTYHRGGGMRPRTLLTKLLKYEFLSSLLLVYY